MLKISVNPLESMNSKRPVTNPFNNEKVTSSTTVAGRHRLYISNHASPNSALALGAFHLAGGLAVHAGHFDRGLGEQAIAGIVGVHLDTVFGMH